MATIGILGAGMMGSALAFPLADRGHAVRLVGTPLDQAIVDEVRQRGVHPKLTLALPPAITAHPHGDAAAVLAGVDLIALGVSSAGFDYACDVLAPIARADVPVFMITKGLAFDGEAVRTLPDLLHQRIPRIAAPVGIAGPCIAGELARRVPTCVVVAGRDGATNARIADLIRADYYHPFPTDDVVGAEVCAALKNAYAMGIAFAVGLHEKRGGAPGSIAMHNLESACFAQAVLEMRAIVARLGGRAETAAGLAGAGDLDVTTNGGRTGRFGRFLGMGLTRDEAVAAMEGATLECLEILAVMRRVEGAWIARGEARAGELPLLDHMIAVALDGAPVDLPIGRFFGGAPA